MTVSACSSRCSRISFAGGVLRLEGRYSRLQLGEVDVEARRVSVMGSGLVRMISFTTGLEQQLLDGRELGLEDVVLLEEERHVGAVGAVT